jgi:YD repeat-containing protein
LTNRLVVRVFEFDRGKLHVTVLTETVQAIILPHDPATVFVILFAVENALFPQFFEVLEDLLPGEIDIRVLNDCGSGRFTEIFKRLNDGFHTVAPGGHDTSFTGKWDPLGKRVSMHVDDGSVSITTEAHRSLECVVFSHMSEYCIAKLAVGEIAAFLLVSFDGFSGVSSPFFYEPVTVVV